MFFSSFNESNNEIYDFTDKCLADCFGSTDEEIYKKLNSSSEHELKADYEKMINSLKKWADDNNFNMWKKSALVGRLDQFLTYKLSKSLHKEYMKIARDIIHNIN